MGWFQLLQLVLTIASFISRYVERTQVEKAFGDALALAFDKRADAAVAAADDVRSGRVRDDGNDPARRE